MASRSDNTNFATTTVTVHIESSAQKIVNPHTTSNRKKSQSNFSTLPLLYHNETAMAE
jgi:hypothetical protein